ncbi:MAG TPA: class II fructose-bisphosphatase [Candidatus Deferrimicrobiaceae bacterium]|nr:class II fructose-bisphosphatase [Candidatus Deferrimicrobiaceae bacterium]
MEKLLALEMAYVTEAAAIASARLMGRGDRNEADRVATEAMRAAMDEVEMHGTIVIGEGERDEAPMLYIGERVGAAVEGAPEIDIAVDPLEGTNLVATGSANAITVLAASERGGLVHAPDTYLEKLCVGPLAAGHVDITRPPAENVGRIAEALGRKVQDITVIILDRPRHEDLIAEVRETGARIKLITDGDLSAAISCAVQGTGVHAVMGIGGAPEGVITAAALRCLGGEIQARFRYRNHEDQERAARMGHGDADRIYHTEDLASGDHLVFAATGVTVGDLLEGVRFFGGGARTHTLVMAYQTKNVRFVDTVHMFDRERPPSVRL